MAAVITEIKGQLKQKAFKQATDLLLEYVKGGEKVLVDRAILKSNDLLEGVQKNLPPAEFRKYRSRFSYFLNQAEKKHSSALAFLDALFEGRRWKKAGEWEAALPHFEKAYALHQDSFLCSKEALQIEIDQCVRCPKFEEELSQAQSFEQEDSWLYAAIHYRTALKHGAGIPFLEPVLALAEKRFAYCNFVEAYTQLYEAGVAAMEAREWTKAKELFETARAKYQEGFEPGPSTLNELINQCEYGEHLSLSSNLQESEKRKRKNRMLLLTVCSLPILFFLGHTIWTSVASKLVDEPTRFVSQLSSTSRGAELSAPAPSSERISEGSTNFSPLSEQTKESAPKKRKTDEAALYAVATPIPSVKKTPVSRSAPAAPQSDRQLSPASEQAIQSTPVPEPEDSPSEEFSAEHNAQEFENQKVAILPFCDGTGSPAFAQSLYMDATHALSKSGLPSVSRARLRASLRQLSISPDNCNPNQAARIAEELQLGKVLTGSISQEGDTYQITCKVYHPHTSQFGKEFIVSHSDPSTLRTKLQHEISSILD